jgi:hypothetical protein
MKLTALAVIILALVVVVGAMLVMRREAEARAGAL